MQIVDKVKKQGRRVGQTINTIKDSAVSGYHAATIFDAQVTFEHGNGDIADKSTEADQQSGYRRFRKRERSEPRGKDSSEHHRGAHPADQAFPCLLGADGGSHFMTASRFSPYI